jgi:hypothetical protein
LSTKSNRFVLRQAKNFARVAFRGHVKKQNRRDITAAAVSID